MTAPFKLQRRAVLSLAAAATLSGLRRANAETALADPISVDSPTLVIAGPGDSEAATWARLLQVPLAAGLMAGGTLPLRFVGGRDGVTGANQFDARSMPDGSQALLFPGSVGLAWLAGDSRVRFDTAHLLPLLVAVTPGVLMLRGPLHDRPGKAPIRLACPLVPDSQAAALLALDLLGATAVPVGAAPDAASAARAGAADAVFVTGRDLQDKLRPLAEAGLRPAFTMGLKLAPPPGPARALGVPDLADLLPPSRQAEPLVVASTAMAAASVCEVCLGLPRQSPVGAIARWRIACTASLANPDIHAALANGWVHLLSDAGAADAVSAVMVQRNAQMALRRWLDMRLDWQPS